MSRADDAKALAPIAPPCFPTRMQWLEYVATAAEAHRPGHIPGPLVFEAGKPARFNPQMGFCADCDEGHEARMKRVGKCNPKHLIHLFATRGKPMVLYAQHPLSAAFPAMSPEDFKALVDDIAANGQREPVVIFEGAVLDGWHRYNACIEAGREPITTPLIQGLDPITFVLSRNLHRRHLSASQRALAVAACSQWAPVGRPSIAQPGNPASVAGLQRTTAAAAEEAGVGVRTMERAKKVVKDAEPEVVAAVRAGELTVDKAADIATLPRDEQADAMKAPAADRPKAAKKADSAGDPDEAEVLRAEVVRLNERLEEMAKNLAEAVADNESMGRVFDADDRLKAAMDEVVRLRAQVTTLTERVNGLMNEKNAAIRQAKAAQKRAAALEAAA